MAAPFIIPFNFQPVSVTANNSGSYTVPAGKYAKVYVTLNSSMNITASGTTTSFTASMFISNGSSQSVEILLKAGDVLSFSIANGTGSSVTTSGGASSAGLFVSTSANQQALINSSIAAEAKSTLSGYANVAGSANTTMGVGITTFNSFSYVASEYFAIS